MMRDPGPGECGSVGILETQLTPFRSKERSSRRRSRSRSGSGERDRYRRGHEDDWRKKSDAFLQKLSHGPPTDPRLARHHGAGYPPPGPGYGGPPPGYPPVPPPGAGYPGHYPPPATGFHQGYPPPEHHLGDNRDPGRVDTDCVIDL